MLDFKEMLKSIRKESGLSQEIFAKKIGVSTILVAKIESGEREPSKKFVETLARKMKVSPGALIPFVYKIDSECTDNVDEIQKTLILFGGNIQRMIIKKKAKNILK